MAAISSWWDSGSGWLNDSLWNVIRRSAPTMSAPYENALRIAIRRPKSTKATNMDRDVKRVRSFRRFRLDQTRGRNLMPRPPRRTRCVRRVVYDILSYARVRVKVPPPEIAERGWGAPP